VAGAQLVFTPGHTRGHMVLLWQDTFLFVGDHFSPRSVCWFSWDAKIESTEKLSKLRNVTWIFPGHGKWFPVEPGAFPEFIKTRVREMQES
jgi:glyoxylase-like metal-dependent hydrolase (beta-lactamase superfamily II)